MTAPVPSTIVTTYPAGTNQNDSVQAAFNKINTNFTADQTFLNALEARVNALAAYTYTPTGTAASPVTDNTAYTYAQKSTPWTKDTSLATLLFSSTTTRSVVGMDVLTRDSNNVPTLLAFVLKDSSGTSAGGNTYYLVTVSHVPSTGALATVATSSVFATVGTNQQCMGIVATTSQAMRVFFAGVSSGYLDYVADVTCDASGGTLSVGTPKQLGGVYIGPFCTYGGPVNAIGGGLYARGYLFGQASILVPYASGTNSSQYGSSMCGFSRQARTSGSTTFVSNPVVPTAPGNTSAYSFSIDVAGTGKFWFLGTTYLMGTGYRSSIKYLQGDDAAMMELGEVVPPYAYNYNNYIAGLSGSLAVACIYDGTTQRTVAVQAGTGVTGSNITLLPNSEDHGALSSAYPWCGWLTYSANILGILTKVSSASYTLQYMKVTPTANPTTTTGTAVSANVAVATGAYGGTNTLRGVLRLGQSSTTDNYLLFGDSTGSGGGCFCEVHQLS